jgi:2-amino-4-hydroxy-6-hydroxymethyldihydropteridine diphosphokinase
MYFDRFSFTMINTYIILGSNVGQRLSFIEKAKYLLEELVGNIINETSVYSTEPWGVEDQKTYLNQVLLIETELSAEKLIDEILKIEEKLGRIRGEKYAPRTIDIDILLFGDLIIEQPELIIPHPRMQDRNFVLTPLKEIAPDVIHPVFQRSISSLQEQCNDQKEVFILAANEPANTI